MGVFAGIRNGFEFFANATFLFYLSKEKLFSILVFGNVRFNIVVRINHDNVASRGLLDVLRPLSDCRQESVEKRQDGTENFGGFAYVLDGFPQRDFVLWVFMCPINFILFCLYFLVSPFFRLPRQGLPRPIFITTCYHTRQSSSYFIVYLSPAFTPPVLLTYTTTGRHTLQPTPHASEGSIERVGSALLSAMRRMRTGDTYCAHHGVNRGHNSAECIVISQEFAQYHDIIYEYLQTRGLGPYATGPGGRGHKSSRHHPSVGCDRGQGWGVGQVPPPNFPPNVPPNLPPEPFHNSTRHDFSENYPYHNEYRGYSGWEATGQWSPPPADDAYAYEYGVAA